MCTVFSIREAILLNLEGREFNSPRDILEGITVLNGDDPCVNQGLLEDFLGHKIPDDYSGTVRLDGPRVILDIPERGIYHTIDL